MTIHEAKRLLDSSQTNRGELLQCLEDLCKEYGYIQGMTIANLREIVTGRRTLGEMQGLIEQLKDKLK